MTRAVSRGRAVTARAEDASGRQYVLKVEHVAPVPGFEWMTAVSLRLSDDLSDVGDVLAWTARHEETHPREFLLAGAAIAALTASIGCSLIGAGGVIGMALATVAAGAPVWLAVRAVR